MDGLIRLSGCRGVPRQSFNGFALVQKLGDLVSSPIRWEAADLAFVPVKRWMSSPWIALVISDTLLLITRKAKPLLQGSTP